MVNFGRLYSTCTFYVLHCFDMKIVKMQKDLTNARCFTIRRIGEIKDAVLTAITDYFTEKEHARIKRLQ